MHNFQFSFLQFVLFRFLHFKYAYKCFIKYFETIRDNDDRSVSLKRNTNEYEHKSFFFFLLLLLSKSVCMQMENVEIVDHLVKYLEVFQSSVRVSDYAR